MLGHRTEIGEKFYDKCDDDADANKQRCKKSERCSAKTLQTTAWADLQQNEVAGSNADAHHNVGGGGRCTTALKARDVKPRLMEAGSRSAPRR